MSRVPTPVLVIYRVLVSWHGRRTIGFTEPNSPNHRSLGLKSEKS